MDSESHCAQPALVETGVWVNVISESQHNLKDDSLELIEIT
jgi:hypothetical protein